MASCEPFLDVYDESSLVAESTFRGAVPDRTPPPALGAVRHLLPEPVWAGHPHHIACYWKAWELAFGNLQRAHRANGFIAPYIDTAFNDCLFAWDSVFILEFARYGRRAFDFQRTLDNLYSKQHSDGFISREVRSWTGRDQFHRHDPASTGPNVFAWCEWNHYRETGDRGRLARVLPVLLAYHMWLRVWRTNADGSYQSCGLACGMDNQPRTLPGASAWTHHSWQAWVDATAQALLSARLLVRMAAELGHCTIPTTTHGASAEAAAVFEPGARYADAIAGCAAEVGTLTKYLNDCMWDARAAMYADRRLRPASLGVSSSSDGGRIGSGNDGSGAGALSPVRTVGAYWVLLAGAVPLPRLAPFAAHLDDPASFNRPLRVPSLARSDPSYRADGGYWLGGVWPPTTLMVLRGLTEAAAAAATASDTQADAAATADGGAVAAAPMLRNCLADIAADIGRNYNEGVVRCFQATGTLWENMAPEPAPAAGGAPSRQSTPVPGTPAKGDFVGWAGIGPVAVLFEYVFGLRADAPAGALHWDVRLLDAHGVRRLPLGSRGVVDIACAGRGAFDEPPRVTVRTTATLRLVLRWGHSSTADGGFRPDRASAGELREATHVLELPAGAPDAEFVFTAGDSSAAPSRSA